MPQLRLDERVQLKQADILAPCEYHLFDGSSPLQHALPDEKPFKKLEGTELEEPGP